MWECLFKRVYFSDTTRELQSIQLFSGNFKMTFWTKLKSEVLSSQSYQVLVFIQGVHVISVFIKILFITFSTQKMSNIFFR